MSFSFEVKETDLLGRIGRLSVGGKEVETPCLFPVVHPVRQSVPAAELRRMGFNGLMTNSYIVYSRRREEALQRGIQEILGYDGMVMTDSGGYQVLQYGKVDIGYREIAYFQARIGSNLAVTLDRPTGYSRSRAYAKGTVDYSLTNAEATLKDFGSSETVWMGPIQGGLLADLVKLSARRLVGAGFRVLALGSPTQLMQSYLFSELATMIVAARRVVPYSIPLHLFGAGHPLTMAMSVALGCDTFDSASYVLFARQGRYMTERGVMRLQQMEYLPCSCPSCNSTSVAGLKGMEHAERSRVMAVHNLWVLKKEVETCKEAISEGRLWDLVEERATAHPRIYEAFAAMSRARELLEAGTPLLKEKGLLVRGAADLSRPELTTASARLARLRPKGNPHARLVLTEDQAPLASGAGRTGEDVYRLHPQLGVYPAELDFVYPFTQTTSPRSEHHDLRSARRRLREMGYASVAVVRPRAKGRKAPRSRPNRRGASPSPRSASARSR